MSDEIISRLLRKHNKIEFLNESVNDLYEADDDEDKDDASGADEEFAALNDEDADTSSDDLGNEEDHDDSQAPIQGKPDDPEPPSSSHAPMRDFGGEDDEDTEAPTPESEPKKDSNEPQVYENPLDNEYAVHFTLGDEVSLTAIGTKNSDLKTGVIEGYDPEGFYKVKWSDESTTNGLTDIALESLVKNMKESKCICGGTDFVEEDGQTICDKCGRIHESKSDPLMLADKSRPKGKRMIRSEAHPVSTAIRPNIAEAIRSALTGRSIKEGEESELVEGTFDKLKTLDNEFWTRREEMKKDIEELGYTVEEMNDEYVIVSSNEDEENVYQIPVGGTSRTMTLDISKAKMI